MGGLGGSEGAILGFLGGLGRILDHIGVLWRSLGGFLGGFWEALESIFEAILEFFGARFGAWRVDFVRSVEF